MCVTLVIFDLLGTPPRLATTTINITVLDGNDNAPEFIGVPYIVSIAETRTTERLLVLTINATDLDAGDSGEIQFRLAGGDSGLFEIDDTSVSLNVVTLCQTNTTVAAVTDPYLQSHA